jgi:hypothetical protein
MRVTTENGKARFPGSTSEGRALLRAMPTHPLHPLAIYLQERGVGIGRGAALLGVSERALREVLAGRARFVWWRERDIAIDLGFTDPEQLFPTAPRS